MADPRNESIDAGTVVLADILEQFRFQKSLADRALAQIQPAHWHATLDPESNSIAAIVKHVAGNLRSRWTDFLTTDGEKPDRDRDGEFEPAGSSPQELLEAWERGWQIVRGTVAALDSADLLRVVTIRGEPHTVVKALVRSVVHTGHHVGQIVLLAKHLRSGSWQTLSIPKRRR